MGCGLRLRRAKSCKVRGLASRKKPLSSPTDRFVTGAAFLNQSLFTTYKFSPPATIDEAAQEADFDIPPFQISLGALLETLQIFGINDSKDKWSRRDDVDDGYARSGTSTAFESRLLGIDGVCKLSYAAIGDPLCIFLEEAGVTTTCELVTYEADQFEEIPLQTDAITQKIIMRASWLHDAINELSTTSPTRLTIVSAPTAPYFTLSSSGPLGSAIMEFSKDPQLLETFQVPGKTINIYKFSLVKGASRAMEIATKVSIRTDEPGVLSLQFMIEVEENRCSFVDFRFVPFLPEEGETDQES